MLKNGYAFYDVEVSIDGGRETSESDVKFEYYTEPSVSSISPGLGPVLGGTNVTVFGKGFAAKAVYKRVVRLGHIDIEGDSVTIVNDTVMTFKTPEVTVENSAPVAIALNGQ
jgi:hypothetical protein